MLFTPSDSPDADTRRPVVWSIAGVDSGGGAGLHADVRALDAFGVHGAGAVAALTAQNSRAVERIEPVSAAMLDAQLAALADDLSPDAIKTGLLGSAANLRVVADWVKRLRRRGRPVPLVVDPVFAATTGARFADAELMAAYRDELLPLATLATPNLQEARGLAGAASPADGESAPCALARAWREFGAQAVVVTGGGTEDVETSRGRPARPSLAADWLSSDHLQACEGWLVSPRVATAHHHGTGCTHASAAAAALAHGFAAAEAAVLAKMATTHALRGAYAAGAGAGPVAPRPGFALRRANLPGLSARPAGAAARTFAPLPESARGLYPIVDSAAWVEDVLRAGVRLVQLRIKDGSTNRLAGEIRRATAAARGAQATLIVNDHWQLAVEFGAHGVHLGQDDLPGADLDAIAGAGCLLGISTHSYWEVCRAAALAPSYIACGPIHATQLKQMPWRPQGEDNLAYWCRLLQGTPVVAIGGMDAARAAAAMACGAHAVGVVGAITRSDDPRAAIARLQAAIATAAREPARAVPSWARPTLVAHEG